MAKGKKHEVSRETIVEAIYESFGTLTKASQILQMPIRTLYEYVELEQLWPDIEKARQIEGQIRDDLALTAIDKLAQELKREPAVALRAAHLTLTRRGGTRKDWVPKEANGEAEGEKSDALDIFRQWIVSKRDEATLTSSSKISEELET
jgi:hypothetical protein